MTDVMSEIGKAHIGGYVYVIGFENHLVKVGHTTNPKVRLTAIKGAANTFGTRCADTWLSPLHLEYRANEDALIAHMKRAGGVTAQREYFTGVNFDRSVEIALTLDYPAFEVSEEMLTNSQAGRTLRSALMDRAALAGPGGPLGQFFYSRDEIAEHKRKQDAARVKSPSSVIQALLRSLPAAGLHDIVALALNEMERRDFDILIDENAIQTTWADITKGHDNRFTSVYSDPKIVAKANLPMFLELGAA